jgi:hypothetical protein
MPGLTIARGLVEPNGGHIEAHGAVSAPAGVENAKRRPAKPSVRR